MTYLELVNAVLLRLREDTASSVTENSYIALIAAFVNEAKKEVEDSWNWSDLRTNIDLSTVGSVASYNLTGSTSRTRILDAYNVDKKTTLRQIKNLAYLNLHNTLQTATGSPYWFDVIGSNPDTDEYKVRLYPVPTEVETMRFYCVVPQDDLVNDSDVVYVSPNLVIQNAYLRAINERGEDQGNLSATQAALYQSFLSTAIAQDAENYSDELVWHPI